MGASGGALGVAPPDVAIGGKGGGSDEKLAAQADPCNCFCWPRFWWWFGSPGDTDDLAGISGQVALPPATGSSAGIAEIDYGTGEAGAAASASLPSIGAASPTAPVSSYSNLGGRVATIGLFGAGAAPFWAGGGTASPLGVIGAAGGGGAGFAVAPRAADGQRARPLAASLPEAWGGGASATVPGAWRGPAPLSAVPSNPLAEPPPAAPGTALTPGSAVSAVIAPLEEGGGANTHPIPVTVLVTPPDAQILGIAPRPGALRALRVPPYGGSIDRSLPDATPGAGVRARRQPALEDGFEAAGYDREIVLAPSRPAAADLPDSVDVARPAQGRIGDMPDVGASAAPMPEHAVADATEPASAAAPSIVPFGTPSVSAATASFAGAVASASRALATGEAASPLTNALAGAGQVQIGGRGGGVSGLNAQVRRYRDAEAAYDKARADAGEARREYERTHDTAKGKGVNDPSVSAGDIDKAGRDSLDAEADRAAAGAELDAAYTEMNRSYDADLKAIGGNKKLLDKLLREDEKRTDRYEARRLEGNPNFNSLTKADKAFQASFGTKYALNGVKNSIDHLSDPGLHNPKTPQGAAYKEARAAYKEAQAAVKEANRAAKEARNLASKSGTPTEKATRAAAKAEAKAKIADAKAKYAEAKAQETRVKADKKSTEAQKARAEANSAQAKASVKRAEAADKKREAADARNDAKNDPINKRKQDEAIKKESEVKTEEAAAELAQEDANEAVDRASVAEAAAGGATATPCTCKTPCPWWSSCICLPPASPGGDPGRGAGGGGMGKSAVGGAAPLAPPDTGGQAGAAPKTDDPADGKKKEDEKKPANSTQSKSDGDGAKDDQAKKPEQQDAGKGEKGKCGADEPKKEPQDGRGETHAPEKKEDDKDKGKKPGNGTPPADGGDKNRPTVGGQEPPPRRRNRWETYPDPGDGSIPPVKPYGSPDDGTKEPPKRDGPTEGKKENGKGTDAGTTDGGKTDGGETNDAPTVGKTSDSRSNASRTKDPCESELWLGLFFNGAHPAGTSDYTSSSVALSMDQYESNAKKRGANGFAFYTTYSIDIPSQRNDWNEFLANVVAAHKFICEKVCRYLGQKCPKSRIKIDLFGWSRGGIAALWLAQALKKKGCQCGGATGGTGSLPIRFVGLLDPVDSSLLIPDVYADFLSGMRDEFFDPDNFDSAEYWVPDNVENFWVGYADHKEPIDSLPIGAKQAAPYLVFNADDVKVPRGSPTRDLSPTAMFVTSHQGIGYSNTDGGASKAMDRAYSGVAK